ncbi:MAG: hypothetical protein LQ346_004338 [Caloplaca aetnensis]|nr:MAG: hypothetical protein LQ346_004338 [Caloplaca aetnensis]
MTANQRRRKARKDFFAKWDDDNPSAWDEQLAFEYFDGVRRGGLGFDARDYELLIIRVVLGEQWQRWQTKNIEDDFTVARQAVEDGLREPALIMSFVDQCQSEITQWAEFSLSFQADLHCECNPKELRTWNDRLHILRGRLSNIRDDSPQTVLEEVDGLELPRKLALHIAEYQELVDTHQVMIDMNERSGYSELMEGFRKTNQSLRSELKVSTDNLEEARGQVTGVEHTLHRVEAELAQANSELCVLRTVSSHPGDRDEESSIHHGRHAQPLISKDQERIRQLEQIGADKDIALLEARRLNETQLSRIKELEERESERR